MMKKSSEVLGLKVIGIKEGLEKGVAQDFMIDAATKRVKYLIIKTDSGYGFRAMNVGDVVSIGADYVMTTTANNIINLYESKEVMEEVERGFFILEATVLSSSGDIISTVRDFSFDERTGELVTIYLGDGTEFPADIRATLAGKIVFINSDGANLSDVMLEAVAYEEYEEPIAEAVAEAIAEEPQPEPEVDIVAEFAAEPEAPAQRSALEEEAINFLIGKTVMSEIVSDDGLFRLEEGTVLTPEIIDLAEQHDAILTLTLSV